MEKGLLKVIVAGAAVILLTAAGAGYAEEFYQGRGSMQIDCDFLDYSAVHAEVILSNGETSIDKSVETQDNGLQKEMTATSSGTYNSSHEIIIWLDNSVAAEGSVTTADNVREDGFITSGSGTAVENITSDSYLDKHRIIYLTNN